jgi:hypothetical protein
LGGDDTTSNGHFAAVPAHTALDAIQPPDIENPRTANL